MAYPANDLDSANAIAILFEERDLDRLVELFPHDDQEMERLRLHYLEVDETESEAEEAIDLELEEVQSEAEIQEEAEPEEQDYDTMELLSMESLRSEGIDAVGLYLKEMARVPLLSNEEEVYLAKRIELGKKAERKLAQLNGRTPKAEKEAMTVLVEDAKDARDHLIKANTRLVVSIAKKYMGRGVPFLDLIQEGNLGLMKAVNKYDYRRGFRFSTYATWWIRQTITRSIADQGRTIRVPVHMVDRIRQLYKLTHEMEQELGRLPTSEELGEKMEIPTSKVEWMTRVSWLPLSLESPINDDEEDSELGQFIEDQLTPTPIQSAYSKLLREKIEEVLDTLPPREARILRLRFGLENGHNYTLEEVGEKFGLTRERIRQIEAKALRKLRHPSRSKRLKDFLD